MNTTPASQSVDLDKQVATNEIAIAVSILVHRLRDLEECTRALVPLVAMKRQEEILEVEKELKASKNLSFDGKDPTEDHRIKKLLRAISRRRRYAASASFEALARSLFLGYFSEYDAFIGRLVEAVCIRKPELFAVIAGNSQVTASDVFEASSIQDFKSALLERQIDVLRRKSYLEQFADFEKWFGIELRKFANWPVFVEASQRRNLFAHCDGVVSAQYLKMCRQERVKVADSLKVGFRFDLKPAYTVAACRCIMEVGVKLAHALWRKLLPGEMDLADHQLHSLAYEGLELEEWSWAETLTDYQLGQRRVKDDLYRRIAIINKAIAYKFGGKQELAVAELDQQDWSAALPEFMLARAVLKDNFDEAAQLMLRIGHEGVILKRFAYVNWPLFRAFRTSDVFLTTFRAIYGHDFEANVQEAAGELASHKRIEVPTALVGTATPNGGIDNIADGPSSPIDDKLSKVNNMIASTDN